MNPLTPNPFIDIQDVAHAFEHSDRQTALEVLTKTSLGIRKGELISFIGPSGCGKSTLLNVMGGLLRPKSGNFLNKINELQRTGRSTLGHY